ncbi:lysophospholipase-like protein 1 isoform X1 [Hyperolius riggenbachi]|uniref:lysophospholipase-like protein 1 isoform X1 n=1 Tax=Hyperolius riggenbachi TaxID=752182 RepID=UPI0035A2A11B
MLESQNMGSRKMWKASGVSIETQINTYQVVTHPVPLITASSTPRTTQSRQSTGMEHAQCAGRSQSGVMAASCSLTRCVVGPAGKHTASVIFLHGSGDSGQGIRAWIRELLQKDFAFKHIKVIFPTAPARPYTPMRGALSNVWFDRHKISIESPENLESVDSMCKVLTDLINEEVASGVKKSRILLGGFSMGGGMAMHLAYRYHKDVAGVFALSSFLNDNSIVYKELEGHQQNIPELFQCHGQSDELVFHQWGERTHTLLKGLGVPSSFHSFPNLYHELSVQELEQLKAWIKQKLPDTPTDTL